MYMAALLICALLLLLSMVVASLRPIYGIVTQKELLRRAKKGDHVAATLHDVARHGITADATLLLVSIVTAALAFVIIATQLNGLLAVIIVAVFILVIFSILPKRTSKVSRQIALKVSPYLGSFLQKIRPLSDKVIAKVQQSRPITIHTGLYEKEDLIELLQLQKVVPHNRIEATELELAAHALTFGDKQVKDYMIPRRVVHLVRSGDPVGPVLLTELYDSGFSRFPVHNEEADAIVGTLFLKDLVEKKATGIVANVMNPAVFYVNDTSPLEEVLAAFIKTKHHLFIVVNSFEENVGIITIEDVLEQIIGRKIVDEFDRYDDMRQVAARAATKEAKSHKKP